MDGVTQIRLDFFCWNLESVEHGIRILLDTLYGREIQIYIITYIIRIIVYAKYNISSITKSDFEIIFEAFKSNFSKSICERNIIFPILNSFNQSL